MSLGCFRPRATSLSSFSLDCLPAAWGLGCSSCAQIQAIPKPGREPSIIWTVHKNQATNIGSRPHRLSFDHLRSHRGASVGDKFEIATCWKSKVGCVCARKAGDTFRSIGEPCTYTRAMCTGDIDELLGKEHLKLFGIGLGWHVRYKCPNNCHRSSRRYNTA